MTESSNSTFLAFLLCRCRRHKLATANSRSIDIYTCGASVQEIESYPTAVGLQETNSISRGVVASASPSPSQKASATISAAEKFSHDYAAIWAGLPTKTQTLRRHRLKRRNLAHVCLFACVWDRWQWVKRVQPMPRYTRRMRCTHNHARAHRCRYTQMRRAIRIITHCRADGEHLFANRVAGCRMNALIWDRVK